MLKRTPTPKIDNQYDVSAILGSLSSTRQTAEVMATALRELDLRLERDKQEKAGGLINFVRYFWEVLEPNREFSEGWALEAMAEHLEAVTNGDITRILINVPPGSCKSLLTNVFWPAWEWSARNKPGTRYISFSYSSLLTERDNQRFMDLIESRKFQDLWGHRFRLRSKGVTKVSNDKHGWKFASSVRGTGTGERADRILCFPEDALVATEHGPMQIGDIVRQRLQIKVWSRNMKTGRLELRPVIGWRHNPGSPLVKLSLADGGSLRCTPDHRLFTRRGWRPAGEMSPHTTRSDMGDGLSRRVESFSQDDGSLGRRVNFQDFVFGKFGAGTRMLGSGPDSVFLGNTKVFPRPSGENSVDSGGANAILFREGRSRFGVALRDLKDKFVRKVRSSIAKMAVPFAVGDVLRSRPVFEIGEAGIGPVVVSMPDFLSFWARTDERQHDKLMGESIYRFSINSHCDARVPVVKYSRQQSPRNLKLAKFIGGMPVGSQSYSRDTSYSSVIGDFVYSFEIGDRTPNFSAVLGVEPDGHVVETFCLTVEGNHNMFVGENEGKLYLASNCDDPHNIKEGESKTIREETVRWFKEAMSNRLNHMTKSAIVVIMQRVHEDDVSGAIISGELPYEHLMIPLLYESDRHCETSIGWSDPREIDGDNYWPERMPEQAVEEAKQMGEFAFVAQYQQRPSPRGGGIFKVDWWNIWEPEDGRYPTFDFIIASCDPAYTDRDENDPCGFVILGVNYKDDGTPRVFLIAAWRKWLLLHGPEVIRELGEPQDAFLLRQKETWGVCEWIAHSCKRFKVDRLLIEAKASGLSIGQEMDRLMFDREFMIELVNPGKSDKSVRANRVQHIFAAGMVYRPDRKWAEMVQDEMAAFPKAKYDDLLDAMTQGLWWLRNHRMLETKDEIKAANVVPAGVPRDHAPLYPV